MNDWDGKERRDECIRYCNAHIQQVQNMTRIETKLESIEQKIDLNFKIVEKHVEQGEKWRIAIIGIIFAGIIQVIATAYMWGGLNKQVNINTERWNRVLAQGGLK